MAAESPAHSVTHPPASRTMKACSWAAAMARGHGVAARVDRLSGMKPLSCSRCARGIGRKRNRPGNTRALFRGAVLGEPAASHGVAHDVRTAAQGELLERTGL